MAPEDNDPNRVTVPDFRIELKNGRTRYPLNILAGDKVSTANVIVQAAERAR